MNENKYACGGGGGSTAKSKPISEGWQLRGHLLSQPVNLCSVEPLLLLQTTLVPNLQRRGWDMESSPKQTRNKSLGLSLRVVTRHELRGKGTGQHCQSMHIECVAGITDLCPSPSFL